jgi:hypothetical protein
MSIVQLEQGTYIEFPEREKLISVLLKCAERISPLDITQNEMVSDMEAVKLINDCRLLAHDLFPPRVK